MIEYRLEKLISVKWKIQGMRDRQMIDKMQNYAKAIRNNTGMKHSTEPIKEHILVNEHSPLISNTSIVAKAKLHGASFGRTN